MQVLERGWLSSNSIVFDDGSAVTIVDTGYVSHAPLLVQLVEQLRRGRPLARIVNTHLHSDHVGGNAALQARFRPTIAIPPGQAAAVRQWDEQRLNYAATGQQCARFDYDTLIDLDRPLRLGGLDWEVIGGGGHDPEMALFHSHDERILVSADALWENGFGVIFPELEGASGFAEQQAVLDRISALAPRIVIPGHGAAFADSGAALEAAYRRLEYLRSDPQRNARHAAKVLIKFWLLDVRSTTMQRLHRHFARTDYLRLIQRRYFPRLDLAQMIDSYVDELVRAGAAEFAGGLLHNRD
ncbi:MAG: MBL fold metallo-hydrolase [Burkholderiales bacterium]|nr:MBL fold metallo-hydrolase [Burkholderiales bacterium]